MREGATSNKVAVGEQRENKIKKGTRILCAAAGLSAATGFAQIATDGSLGPRQSFIGQSITIPSSIGRYVNGNLFHSFQVFNVTGGQAVTFLPTPITLQTPTMNNIIARVTGGAPSTIQGTVRSTTPGVNLYLINPSGLVIGFDAIIDVNGSFYASTAHYLRSADGTKFESRGPGVSLTFTTPDGFGFDSSTVAPITIQGGTLRVRDGAALGIVGGAMRVGHASQPVTLQALGGTALLVGVASPGVVEYGPQGVVLNGFGALADVTVQSGALVNVTESTARAGGGTIVVRGGNITVDRATLTGRSTFGNGRLVDLGAAGDLIISQGNVLATTVGPGNAGRIRLSGNNIVVSNGSLVDTSCDPGCTTGSGGAMEVVARELFRIDGTTAITFVVSNSFGGGRTGEIDVTAGTLVLEGTAFLQGIGTRAGNASAIRIHSGDILLRGGAQIDASARGTGQGGRITVENTGTIRIEGSRRDPSQGGLITPSGILSNTDGSGNAGSIVISTRTLDVVGGGEISSSTRRGTGAGGSVSITAAEAIRVSGTDDTLKASGIVTNTFAGGNAGDITLSAPTIQVSDLGKIQSQSEGTGRGGRILITGRDLTLTGRGQISSSSRSTGDAGAVEARLTGTLSISDGESGIFTKTFSAQGGNITVDARNVVLENFGGIFATTDGSGFGGQVNVHASDSIQVDGGRISASTQSSGDARTVDVRADGRISISGEGRIGTSTRGGSGNAGSVLVQAGTELVMSGGTITSETFPGSGNAGNVEVRSDGQVNLRNGARVTTSTAGAGNAGAVTLFGRNAVNLESRAAITSETSGAGRGGRVEVRSAGVVNVQDNARVSTSASGSGDGGSVTLFGGERVNVSIGGAIASESSDAGIAGNVDVRSGGTLQVTNGGRITTAATFSDGGNIFIESPQGFMDGGRITTAVGTGQGDGGNMEIRIPTFVLNNSTISANAFGGDGGNIHIATETFFKSANSSVTASSALGVDGTITLDSPAIDPAGQLLPPSPSYLDAGAVLAGRCGARLAGRASSLVIVARPAQGALPGGLHTTFDSALADPWYATNALACEALRQ